MNQVMSFSGGAKGVVLEAITCPSTSQPLDGPSLVVEQSTRSPSPTSNPNASRLIGVGPSGTTKWVDMFCLKNITYLKEGQT